MDKSSRKRNIEETENPEDPPSPSRYRISKVFKGFDAVRQQQQCVIHFGTASSEPSDEEGSTSSKPISSSIRQVIEDEDNHEIISGSNNRLRADNAKSQHVNTQKPVTNKAQAVVPPASSVSGFHRVAFPKSWGEASDADHTLFRMKNENRTWDEIQRVWKEKTGNDITKKGLSKRFIRLRDQLQDIQEVDTDLLFDVVEKIEEGFAREKWQLVTEAMARKGASGYSKDFFEKQWHRQKSIDRPPKPGDAIDPRLRELDRVSAQEIPRMNGTSGHLAVESDRSKQDFIARKPLNLSTPKPGSLLRNAITTVDANSQVAPIPKLAASIINPSREGSATNRGPARFISYHESTDDDATRKARNALKKTNTKETVELTTDGNGLQASKTSDDTAMADLKSQSEVENASGTLTNQGGVGQSSGDGPSVEIAQPQASPGISNPRPPLPHGLPPRVSASINEAPNKPLHYCRPQEQQAPRPSESAILSSPKHSAEDQGLPSSININSHATFPAVNSTENKSPAVQTSPKQGRSPGRPKKAVTKPQLKYMIKHRRLNETNRNKPWDVIAYECGVKATLQEISTALNEAGFASILDPSKPQPSADSFASSSPLAEATGDVSPYTPTGANETPNPTTGSQLEETPRTRRRGRPPKSAEKQTPREPESPSQVPKNLKHSSAMKAAWARRKAKGTNGLYGGPPKSSTVAKSSTTGDSAAFAAQILAAAALQNNQTPQPASEASSARVTPTPAPATRVDAPIDLLTGESMFAHQDETTPAPFEGQPPAKKIVRRNTSFRPAPIANET